MIPGTPVGGYKAPGFRIEIMKNLDMSGYDIFFVRIGDREKRAFIKSFNAKKMPCATTLKKARNVAKKLRDIIAR